MSTGGNIYLDVSSLPFQVLLGALISLRKRVARLKEYQHDKYYQGLLSFAFVRMEQQRSRRGRFVILRNRRRIFKRNCGNSDAN